MLSRSILTVSVSLVLAACGGGGGGGGTPVSNNPSVTEQGTPIPPSPRPVTQSPSGRSGSGSIVQTAKLESPTDITNKITFDRITIRFDEDLGISNQNEWDIKFSDGGELGTLHPFYIIINNPPHLAENNNRKYNFVYRFGSNGSKDLDGNIINIDGIFRKNDYLTLGHWNIAYLSKCDFVNPTKCRNNNSYVPREYGSFIFGNDLFTDVKIRGSANYEGVAKLHVSNPTSNNFISTFNDLHGDTFLSVDFEKGTIYGRIDNFIVPQDGLSHINTSTLGNKRVSGIINLNNAEIKTINNGFFEGNLTGNFNGISYEGTYGGQFYGNNKSDGLPGTVAGTLNAVSENGTYLLYGAWMGDK